MNHKSRWDEQVKALGMTATGYLRENCGHLTDSQMAQDLILAGFKTNLNSVEKKRERLGIGKVLTYDHNYAPYDAKSLIGESSFAKYDSPPVINADRVVILPDIQLPYCHHEFLNHVLDLCRAWNVRHCVLAGDVIENASLSHFDPAWTGAGNSEGISDGVVDDLLDAMARMPKKIADEVRGVIDKHGRKTITNADGISDEWGYAKKPLATIVSLFDSIVWILGNHEGRLLRQMQSPFLPDDLRRMFVGDDPKVQIAPYYYCKIVSNDVEWQIIHPKSSAKGDAKWYASKYLCHTIMAHNHQVVLQKDRSGKFWAIETGCMVDEQRLPYVSQRQNKADMHLLGATIIKNGYAWLLTEDSDWKSLKKI